MVRGTILLVPGKIILPVVQTAPNIQVSIIDKGGTTHDILNDVISIDITQASRESLWGCYVTAANVNGAYTNKYTGGETLVVKADYGSGTTLQFRGKIDKQTRSVSKSTGFSITWDARNYPELVDQYVTFRWGGVTPSEAMKGTAAGGTVDSYSNYPDGVLYGTSIVWDPDNSASAATELMYVFYQDRTRWDIIKDVCSLYDYDCYVWYNETLSGLHAAATWYLKMYKEGTITSSEDIVWGKNMTGLSNVGNDNTKIRNRITVSGRDADGFLLLQTANDDDSQSDLWLRELKVTDNALKTMDEATTKVTDLKDYWSTSRLAGSVSSLGLVTTRPGNKIEVYAPNMGLNSSYIIRTLTHRLDARGWTTSVQFEDREISLPQRFALQREQALALQEADNQWGFTDTINLTFDKTTDDENFVESSSNIEYFKGSSETDTGVRIAGLTVDNPSGTGQIISKTLSLDHDIDICQLRIANASSIDECSYWVSTNNGLSYVEMPYTFSPDAINVTGELQSIPSGRKIKLKVILVSSGTSYDPMFKSFVLKLK